jgi:hypothetical protein
MVLRLKTRESRSLPGLLKAIHAKGVIQSSQTRKPTARAETKGRPQSGLPSFWGKGRQRQTCRRTQTVRILGDAGWSSPFGRQSIHWIDCIFGLTSSGSPDIAPGPKVRILGNAGWSSPVARQAHNLKAAGSNPAPATKTSKHRHVIAGAKNSSSLAMVARRPADHNLKAAGSNPAAETNTFPVFPPCDRPASLVELLRTPICPDAKPCGRQSVRPIDGRPQPVGPDPPLAEPGYPATAGP